MKISDLRFKKIKSSRGREFIVKHHYSGTCHSNPICFGIFDGNELIGVCGFANPISENVRKSLWKQEYKDEMKDYVTELHRLVTLDKCPKNTESWFISKSLKGIKKYKPDYRVIVSFADSTEGHTGVVYQATNFNYYGTTDEVTFYRDEEGRLRPPRINGENISLEEAERRDWEPEKRKSKHRYYYLLPDDEYSEKQLEEMMDVEVMEYPKSELDTVEREPVVRQVDEESIKDW